MRLAAALLATAALLVAPTAALAGRSVPRGFFGMNWDQEVSYRTSLPTRAEQWGNMAAAGAEAVRTPVLWSKAQPNKHGAINWKGTDGLVTLAAEHGVEPIPVVTQAPKWDRKYAKKPFSPPSNDAAYTRYLRKLVKHYGPKGSFWKHHPELPKLPVHSVQVWNEPSEYYQWSIPDGKDWAPGYGKLLRKSYTAIKKEDARVKVVLAGLPNTSPQYLDHLYQKGHVHGHFDIAAVHPYTAHKHGVLTLARQFRAVMNKHGDRHRKLWVTELGLPASVHDMDFLTEAAGSVSEDFLREMESEVHPTDQMIEIYTSGSMALSMLIKSRRLRIPRIDSGDFAAPTATSRTLSPDPSAPRMRSNTPQSCRPCSTSYADNSAAACSIGAASRRVCSAMRGS